MKGRIAWVFWLVVVLAVLTSTASYAWLAINASAGVRGIEIEALSDSLFLEISADRDAGYDKSVSFDQVEFYGNNANGEDKSLSFITYKRIRKEGAIRINPVEVKRGVYNGTGQYFKAVRSDLSNSENTYYSYINVTKELKEDDSLVGLYTLVRGNWDSVSKTYDQNYYYESVRLDNTIDYVCIGKIPEGEILAGRVIWGYADSNDLNDPQIDNTINVISLDFPPEEYRLHKTVYLRCADGTQDAKNLKISEVEIEGRSYLESAIRIMFVAKSDSGETVTRFYSHRNPEEFDRSLFANILGDGKEVVTVDIYVFFDGADPDAYDKGSIYTRSDVTVKFSIDDHDYN